jgi:hypothetical protein
MQLFICLLALVAVVMAGASKSGAASCDAFTSEKTCMANSAAGEKCAWCSSAAVGSTCFPESDAKGLPSSVFTCKYQAAYSLAAATSCDAYTSEKTCMSGTAGGEKCSWCNSAAVGSTCFSESDAKSLPSSVFTCNYQLVPLKATACDSITSEKTCMSSSSGGEKCSWCKSAAVGGTCFIESDAKTLPSSVFQCAYQLVPLKTTSCDSYTSEKTCMSGSADGAKCAWCKSAAVGATCFVEEDAKSLPSSVFTCEYQAAYAAKGLRGN